MHIEMIGEFNIAAGGAAVPPGTHPDDRDGVRAVLITADPPTGLACLTSTETGTVTPNPASTVLFTH